MGLYNLKYSNFINKNFITWSFHSPRKYEIFFIIFGNFLYIVSLAGKKKFKILYLKKNYRK